MTVLARGVLWASCAAICALTFGWPLLVSVSADEPAFKTISVGVLIAFFGSMLALLARRIREKA